MKQFQFKNQTYFRAGPGQTRGSIIYLCGATGEMLEVFEGVVTSTGPHYSWVAVTKNRDLNSVRVQRQALQPNLGDLVLIWSLSFGGETVKAEHLMVLGKTEATNPTPPKQAKPASPPSLELGEIASIGATGTFGFIVSQTQESVFLPGSSLRGNLALARGAKVRFRRGATDRGLIALEAYPA